MNGLHCSFCDARGKFDPCACDFDGLFRCGNHPACGKCKMAHKTIGVFFRGLLDSTMQERSNSLRRRLFSIAWELFCENKFPESKHILDTLGRTSPFSPDERKFQACVREAARLLPNNPQVVADLLLTKMKEAALERFWQTCTEHLETEQDRKKWQEELLPSCEAFFRELEVRARLKKHLGL
jgi:hypothetical protein